jgi:hypothetical protein
MSRFNEIVRFIDFDRKNNIVIEPNIRFQSIQERLFDAIKTYNPAVIVKTGIGSGKMLSALVEQTSARIVAVEPSKKAIDDFLSRFSSPSIEKRLNIIHGDFQNFPIDYYKADMVVSIDHLDLFDMSRCIDEFKRALNFDGIFFFAGVSLADDDIEGLYDDFTRTLFPLHTDFYLTEDFKTIMGLKDFTFVKSMVLSFERDLKAAFDYFGTFFGTKSRDDAHEFLSDHRLQFETLYSLTRDEVITEPYLIGIYMRNRPSAANE